MFTNKTPDGRNNVCGAQIAHYRKLSGKSQRELADALQIAGLFGTTLAPFSGFFGWPFGVLAGLLHSSVVLHAGLPLEGMNLYNNGFSGGLVAIVLYPIITSLVRHRRPVLQAEDLFDVFEHDEPQRSSTLIQHDNDDIQMPH